MNVHSHPTLSFGQTKLGKARPRTAECLLFIDVNMRWQEGPENARSRHFLFFFLRRTCLVDTFHQHYAWHFFFFFASAWSLWKCLGWSINCYYVLWDITMSRESRPPIKGRWLVRVAIDRSAERKNKGKNKRWRTKGIVLPHQPKSQRYSFLSLMWCQGIQLFWRIVLNWLLSVRMPVNANIGSNLEHQTTSAHPPTSPFHTLAHAQTQAHSLRLTSKRVAEVVSGGTSSQLAPPELR